MAAQQIRKSIFEFLRSSPAFGSFPFSLMLIGVEEFIELNISCPCKYNLNNYLTASMFIGPPLFIFVLMFIALRPFKNECCRCCPLAEEVEDDQQNCWNVFGHCLIPPMMWIIVLFFDGDYLACCLTTWEGNYVLDEELNRMWCKPIEQANAGNQSDPRRDLQGHIHISKTFGYVVLGIFSVFIFIILGLYDCCISGKCANWSQRFSCFWGQQDVEQERLPINCCCCKQQNVDQSSEHESLSLQQNNSEPNTSSNTADEDANLD